MRATKRETSQAIGTRQGRSIGSCAPFFLNSSEVWLQAKMQSLYSQNAVKNANANSLMA